MSHGVMPFAVSLPQIRKIVGSRSKSLLLELREEFEEELQADREAVEEANLDDEFDPELPLTKALRHLIMDEQRWDYEGPKYGRAVEMLCTHYGEILSNDRWSDVPLTWVEAVHDAVLEACGSEESFSVLDHLFYRGSPIDIPEIEDFPYIGYLKQSEIPTVLGILTDDLLESIHCDHADRVRCSLEQLRDWLSTCQSEKTDLVCFYY